MQVITHAAEMHGCTVEVRWRDPPYLPTINSLEMSNVVKETAKSVLGEDRFQSIGAPTMAGEDFSYMASALHSCSLALCCFNVLEKHPLDAQHCEGDCKYLLHKM